MFGFLHWATLIDLKKQGSLQTTWRVNNHNFDEVPREKLCFRITRFKTPTRYKYDWASQNCYWVLFSVNRFLLTEFVHEIDGLSPNFGPLSTWTDVRSVDGRLRLWRPGVTLKFCSSFLLPIVWTINILPDGWWWTSGRADGWNRRTDERTIH